MPSAAVDRSSPSGRAQTFHMLAAPAPGRKGRHGEVAGQSALYARRSGENFPSPPSLAIMKDGKGR